MIMDPFLIFLTVIISVLTVVLVIVGIQIILILKNINKTLSRANQTLDLAETLIHNLSNPLSDLKSLGNGVKTGLHVAEYVMDWVKQKRSSQEEEDQDVDADK